MLYPSFKSISGYKTVSVANHATLYLDNVKSQPFDIPNDSRPGNLQSPATTCNNDWIIHCMLYFRRWELNTRLQPLRRVHGTRNSTSKIAPRKATLYYVLILNIHDKHTKDLHYD